GCPWSGSSFVRERRASGLLDERGCTNIRARCSAVERTSQDSGRGLSNMNATPTVADDLIVIGKIYSIHGVRGEVKVFSFTDPIGNLLDYKTWTLRREGSVKQVELVSGRLQ